MPDPSAPLVLKIKPQSPTVFLSVNGLFADATLLVASVDKPLPGQTKPVFKRLAVIESDTDQSNGVALPVKTDAQGNATDLGIAGLQFAVTADGVGTVGTITIGIMRDQDTPASPPFARPVTLTLTIVRNAGDPLFREVEIAMQRDV